MFQWCPFCRLTETPSYGEAFFPELIRCFAKELQDGIPPELNTIVLNNIYMLLGKIAPEKSAIGKEIR